MNVTRIAVLGVALVAGAGAFFMMMSTNKGGPVKAAPPVQEKTVRVLVADQDFQRGERLTAEAVKWIDWPEKALSESYITEATGGDPAALEQAVARTSIIAGEPIIEAKIVRADSSGLLAAVVSPGMRAVTMRITPETGTTVTAVVADGLGNKWIGTTSGLHKYDGANWTRCTTSSTSNGLANNYIQDLALDGSGNLWVATGNGVSVFNGVSWTKYNTSNSGLINNNVNTLAISGNVKWFGSSSYGLSKFDGTTWITYTLGTGEFYENFINDIAIAPGGVTWIATGNSMGGSGGGGGALVRFDGANWTSYTSENSGLANPYVFSVAVEPGGAVWAGTESGASRFDGVNWTSYTPADGLAHYWVSALLLDGRDRFLTEFL